MTSKSWISRLGVSLIAFVLTVAPSVSPVYAVEDVRKVSVVSFGFFGDQGVFRREATGAARIVASRFAGGPVNVKYNSKRGGGATIEALATSLQGAAKEIDAESDVLFLILTSHGSRAGLAVKAGELTQTLTPSNLADMLARTGVRHKVVVISACYSGVFIRHIANPDVLVITAASANRPSFGCRDKAKWTYFGDAFLTSHSDKLKAWKTPLLLRERSSVNENYASALSRRIPKWQAAQTCSRYFSRVLEQQRFLGTRRPVRVEISGAIDRSHQLQAAAPSAESSCDRRRTIPTGRIVVEPTVAHTHAIDHGIANRPAALDDPAAHD